MLNTIFPVHIDNVYHGRKAALWLLAIIVLMKTAQSIVVFFDGSFVIASADGIPLDSYPAAASQTILAMFTISALSRFILCLLGILALMRYRSAVAFVFVLLAIDYIGREIILYFDPIARTGEPVGPTVNFILFVLTIIGLIVSLWKRRAE